MQEVNLGKPFFNLPAPCLEDKISEFTLDTELYEKEIAKRNGGLEINLIKKLSIPKEDIAHYEKIVPYHIMKASSHSLADITQFAEIYPMPFAKLVKDQNELEMDILKVYQVAYSHYVIAKHYGFSNCGMDFPHGNCGPSGRSAVATLWMHGFLNSAYALYLNKSRDHGYVILPFVMQKPKFEGVILMDPTSDQLGRYNGRIHRNLVTIKKGTDWTYQTDYDNSANLFPHMTLHLGTLLKKGAIDRDGDLTSGCDRYFNGGKRFLELAYSDPVELNNQFSKR
jgi:hypothetical protein